MQWFRGECKPPFQRASPDTSQVGPGDLCSKQDFAAVRAPACSLKKWHSWAPHQPSPMSPLGNQWEKQWLSAKPQKKGSISLSTNCSSGLFQTGPLVRHNKKGKKKKKRKVEERREYLRESTSSDHYTDPRPTIQEAWVCDALGSCLASLPGLPTQLTKVPLKFFSQWKSVMNNCSGISCGRWVNLGGGTLVPAVTQVRRLHLYEKIHLPWWWCRWSVKCKCWRKRLLFQCLNEIRLIFWIDTP